MSKHTLMGRRKKVIKTSGFRARLKSKTGKKILKNRRRKGRWKLSIQIILINKKDKNDTFKNSKLF